MPSKPEKPSKAKEIALLEMLSLVYEEMDLDVIEERFVSLTAEIFGFDRVGLFFVKHRKGMLQGKLCAGFDAGQISSLEIPVDSNFVLTKPLVSGFPYFSRGNEKDPFLDQLGLRQFALIPIVNKKRLPCWQMKNCQQKGCPAFGKKWLRCWLVPGTKCGSIPSDQIAEKEKLCRECNVYAQQDVDCVEGVLVVDNSLTQTPINQEKVTILSIIAHAVGAAINNAKVFSRTLREAIHDELTGLYNRRFFNERLVDEVDRARRYNSSFSLVICDIDQFKQVNDTFGHPIGDKVLTRIASELKDNIRSSDMVARYGGEEFALLLLNTDKEMAGKLANELRRKIAASIIHEIEGRQVTASFGVATYGADAITLEGLVAKADRALYLAKSQGRNQVIAL